MKNETRQFLSGFYSLLLAIFFLRFFFAELHGHSFGVALFLAVVGWGLSCGLIRFLMFMPLLGSPVLALLFVLCVFVGGWLPAKSLVRQEETTDNVAKFILNSPRAERIARMNIPTTDTPWTDEANTVERFKQKAAATYDIRLTEFPVDFFDKFHSEMLNSGKQDTFNARWQRFTEWFFTHEYPKDGEPPVELFCGDKF